MADYPSNAATTVALAPLDPDITTGSGVPYVWDYGPAIGAGNLASATVVVPATLSQVGNVTLGNVTESTTYPGTYTFTETGNSPRAVQVRLLATAAARTGISYDVTCTAVDANGTPHPRTISIPVADR